MSARSPLVVFSDDWGRHPSSCQHLIRRLLDHREVIWVNTIGMKPPAFNLFTMKRGFEKIREWTFGAKPPPTELGSSPGPSLRVVSPKMWPSFRSRWSRALNRGLVLRSLRPIVASLPSPPIVITTLPVLGGLVGEFPAARWVYYCVDDFSVWPGLDGETVRKRERELVAKVDAVVAVSETLQQHIAKLGKPSHLLTHGVDLEHWRKVRPTEVPASLREIAAQPGPRVVFWGVVDRRMDVPFVRKLSESLNSGSILLIGPQDDPDPQLLKLPRVRLLPSVAYADLPSLAGLSDVLVMPYADLPVTRAMQPLKLKEYLATGKPVVVSDLPTTRQWADSLDVVSTPEAFAKVVQERLRDGVPKSQREARVKLDLEGWTAKAAQFETWLDGAGD